MLTEKVWPPDLLGERAKRAVVFLEGLLLRVRGLRLQEPEEDGHDGLDAEVEPDARVRALEGVRRQQVWFVVRERVLEEFAEDERLKDSLTVGLERGDEAPRVNFCTRMCERVAL